jgi:CRP-like cAMP-binding protein
VRLAVLDEEVTRVIGRRPELLIAFSGRLLHRERCGAYLRAVSHLTRVDEKVLVTLWHLASRWGRVTPEGVQVPFRLTHEVLGEIVGAQRPSVTIALNRMRRAGFLKRGADRRWILLGSPDDWPLARPGMLSDVP